MRNLTQLTIHPHIQVAFLAHLLKQLFVMTFSIPHQRRQEVGFLSLIGIQYQLKHLLFGVFHHLLTTQVGIGISRSCVEQTQKIIDLRSRAHGRTRILIGRLLLNGDDRAQSRDLIHVRALHVTQEVTGIGREGFHITTLSLREEGIKRQRRFTTSAHTGDDRQLATWNLYINILQIVYTGSPNRDLPLLQCRFIVCHFTAFCATYLRFFRAKVQKNLIGGNHPRRIMHHRIGGFIIQVTCFRQAQPEGTSARQQFAVTQPRVETLQVSVGQPLLLRKGG